MDPERGKTVLDEFCEEGRGQIMEGFRDHGKDFIFYCWVGDGNTYQLIILTL